MIAVLPNSADPALAHVVVDPNTINPKGTTAIDWFVPSPDGKRVAVSLSENGMKTEPCMSSTWIPAKRSTRRFHACNTRPAAADWPGARTAPGFWYTRYPGPASPAAEAHFFQQVYFHRIGDALKQDVYVLGKGLPKVAEIAPCPTVSIPVSWSRPSRAATAASSSIF